MSKQPNYLTVMQALNGNEYIRCTTCGREAMNRAKLTHHQECPEVNNE